MKKTPALFISFLAIIFTGKFVAAQTTNDLSVELTAAVQTNPPKITLHWKNITFGSPDYFIYKKSKTATSWGAAIDSMPAGTASYDDLAVIIDSAYEYQLLAPGDSFVSTGYIYAGIRAPAIHNRGIMILLVDSIFVDSCETAITTLLNDLSGDGWQIIRHNFPRTASDVSIKAVILNDYATNPNVNAAFILGHLAVPYSGDIAPDGHLNHLGAWPADVYYACMDTLWTDFIVNDSITISPPANVNIPGDGKWDQIWIPSEAKLQVGRVDFYDMPAFASSEVQLMKNYLSRDHAYKIDSLNINHQAIICDMFGYFGGEGFAANGWRNFSPLVGSDSITVVGYYYLLPYLASSSYQWAYGCGGGTFTSANGIGTTSDFASNPDNNIFMMLFGSNFGDWNVQDNFLRAPLCANPPSLTNCWAGRPNWYFHHMALGETIGYSTIVTQNNYPPLYSSPIEFGNGGVHVALMGDPSLRTDYIKQPANLVINPNQSGASINWTASPDNSVIGYFVYRADSAYGYFEKLNSTIITTTNYQDNISFNGLKYYMVRPVKLQSTASGNYYNIGVGITDTATISIPVTCTEVIQPENKIVVFPNPTQDYLNILISSARNCNATIYILTETGQHIKTVTKQLLTGINNYSLNIKNMMAGAYILVVRRNNRCEEIKWMKQ